MSNHSKLLRKAGDSFILLVCVVLITLMVIALALFNHEVLVGVNQLLIGVLLIFMLALSIVDFSGALLYLRDHYRQDGTLSCPTKTPYETETEE